MTYAAAGVDIDAGHRLVDAIRDPVAATQRPEVLGGLGGFGGLFELPIDRYRQPVLVSGTDGVGTKLKLALDAQRFDGIGIDLVAMCVNDVIVAGAEPLFFLDYYATARLETDVAASVIASIAAGCRQAGAALIGGETAEMPGMYADGDFDLAGFCVGVAEKDRLIDPANVRAGDVVIGLASSGAHANGYSLIRRIIDRAGVPLESPLADAPLITHLLAPTRIYAAALHAAMNVAALHAAAHITGGGLPDNLTRVLPDHLAIDIDTGSWNRPPIFDWLAEHGQVAFAEMHRTLNCGIGFCLVIDAADRDRVLAAAREAGETAHVIGHVVDRTPTGRDPVVLD